MAEEVRKVEVPLPPWLYNKVKKLADWNGLPVGITARLMLGQALDGGSSMLSKPQPVKKSQPATEQASSSAQQSQQPPQPGS